MKKRKNIIFAYFFLVNNWNIKNKPRKPFVRKDPLRILFSLACMPCSLDTIFSHFLDKR